MKRKMVEAFKDVNKFINESANDENKYGFYSSRGTGIPAGGAMFGGDGAHQKLGKPRRKQLPGDMGSPSMGADSTQQMRMSQVNKGYEAGQADEPMFPNQDPDFKYPFIHYRNRKLPFYPGKLRSRLPENHKLIDDVPSLYETFFVPEDEQDEEKQNEFSGCAGVAGFTGPLSGFSSSGKKKKFEKAAGKSFGGGKVAK